MAKDRVQTGESVGVDVIRAPASAVPATIEVATEVVSAVPAGPAVCGAIQWARGAGMLPDMLPGPKLRPSVGNPKAWLYRAAQVRFGMGDYDQITEEEFNRRIAAISTVEVR